MKKIKLNSIEEAIDDIRQGKIIIVVDNEDRENEGDFIIATESITPEVINFMVTHARGLICVALTPERCDELNLEMMTKENDSLIRAAFTVSVDLEGDGCTTGVSVDDRAKTIKALVNKDTMPSELARPGHVFPLKARHGGVFERQGHTEAAVDIVRLAGMYPSGVLVEILNEDGSMARLPDLVKIARKYKMKIISVSDLKLYRKEKIK